LSIDIDLTPIIVILIPTIGVILTYTRKQEQTKNAQKTTIFEEYQKLSGQLNMQYRIFFNQIINKYCNRINIHSIIKTRQTLPDYELKEKENSEIDLSKDYDELINKTRKIWEEQFISLSYLKVSKDTKFLIQASNSYRATLNYLYRIIAIEKKSDNIVSKMYTTEGILINLESLGFSLAVLQASYFDNYFKRMFKKMWYKIKNS